MIFVKRLQQVLQELNINQSELGRRLGVKPQSVQGWLKGVMPRMDKLEKLAELSQHPVHWFFMEEETLGDKMAVSSNDNQPQLTEQQRKIISLLDELPQSDAEQIIRDMEQKRDFYKRKLEELLRQKNKTA
ncbi:helix-turn-helix domain-containing protein [Escherichia coli]|jgi:transcriptional regulator with XRE-family HTH domain|uniref:Helix-turn-helix domain-containing protein n=6 Tax=Enterobacteriaceae TaxID=543 RepID=A0A066Q0N8_ECOLX|nr:MULTISPECIES: helix-turn-helix domain-containing protein [Enterobacteriaceae]EAS9546657.1 helix-turn-helix domain-containing protein [Salmonella enterica]EBH9556103.1 helix-turn-helix domain-containing protein [Salmonella enterica subsp. enterica serovar Cerro]ECV1864758.1 helix-turn-helix domain-containing protein [Salmonella enterica subsp. enterica serovar Montevideo]EES2577183.1 helix-turn-helix domain-containing protein [Escherichia coli O103:H2]EFA7778011.1 helix-turn-helix domain-con